MQRYILRELKRDYYGQPFSFLEYSQGILAYMLEKQRDHFGAQSFSAILEAYTSSCWGKESLSELKKGSRQEIYKRRLLTLLFEDLPLQEFTLSLYQLAQFFSDKNLLLLFDGTTICADILNWQDFKKSRFAAEWQDFDMIEINGAWERFSLCMEMTKVYPELNNEKKLSFGMTFILARQAKDNAETPQQLDKAFIMLEPFITEMQKGPQAKLLQWVRLFVEDFDMGIDGFYWTKKTGNVKADKFRRFLQQQWLKVLKNEHAAFLKLKKLPNYLTGIEDDEKWDGKSIELYNSYFFDYYLWQPQKAQIFLEHIALLAQGKNPQFDKETFFKKAAEDLKIDTEIRAFRLK